MFVYASSNWLVSEKVQRKKVILSFLLFFIDLIDTKTFNVCNIQD